MRNSIDQSDVQEETGRQSRIEKLAHLIEAASITRLINALGIWLFFLTILGFILDGVARSAEHDARNEENRFRKLEQIATSWDVLTRPLGSDSGKGNAINTLIAAGYNLRLVDLSCEQIGDWRNGRCINRPVLNGVRAWIESPWLQKTKDDRICIFSDCEAGSQAVFSGSVITDFEADNLVFSQGLNEVFGERWDIFNPLDDRQSTWWIPNEYSFTCIDCNFWGGEVPLPFFSGSLSGVWSETKVLLKGALEIDLKIDQVDFMSRFNPFTLQEKKFRRMKSYSWRIQSLPPKLTLLDRPLVFVPSDLSLVERREYWELYKWVKYCIAESELDSVRAKLNNFPVLELVNGSSGSEYVESKKKTSPGQIELPRRLGWQYKSIELRVPSKSRNWLTRTVANLVWGDDYVRTQRYRCGFSFDQVKEVLVPHVRQVLQI